MNRKLVKKDADFGCLMIRFVKDGKFYVASGDFPDGNTLITQGKNEQELKENIIDAMATMWEIPLARQQLYKEIKDLLERIPEDEITITCHNTKGGTFVSERVKYLNKSDLSSSIDRIFKKEME